MNIEDVKKMSPEEKEISIATICGWKISDPPDHEDGALMGHHPVPDSEFLGWDMVPDYLNDLNACFEMENLVLQKSDGEPLPDTWDRYCENLALLSGFPKTYLLVHSSAAQRSNAFLATMLP